MYKIFLYPYIFHPTLAPTALIISLDVIKEPSCPRGSMPNATHTAFITLGINVAPATPPTNAPMIPSSIGCLFSFAVCKLSIICISSR